MTMTEATTESFQTLETPFAEATPQSESTPPALGFMAWTEAASPFAEAAGVGFEMEDEQMALLAEAFESLRDEQFDEALAELVNETAEVADARLAGEHGTQLLAERSQLGDAHLAPIGFEAEHTLQRFMESIQHLDPQQLASEQLDEVLERFDPGVLGVSPAGEEFIGGLIRKAKSVVKTVVNVAGKVAKAALPILGPILNKLKALIRPLLKRVLAMAINRLPAPLHQPARMLARRIGIGEAETESFEAEAEELGESESSPVIAGNPEALAESLDAALAESVLGGEALEQGESFGHDRERGGEPEAGTQLESLAEARSTFIGQLQSASEGEDLTPAMEQFIPAILPALRVGIRLVGRPKVVGFLAGFLAKLIGQWTGPQLSRPLSNAIVDVGMRLVGLEHGQPGELEQEAAPAMLASVVEDTVRRLAEQPQHLFEDEDLMQVAVGEAFEQAVAANFPSQLVRPDLRIAPSLGGAFVTCRASRPFAYKKYSRVPEIEVTSSVATSIRTFGGATLDSAVTTAGLKLPNRFRVRIFEAGAGTTLSALARAERLGGASGGRRAVSQLHPLTTLSAGLLLREPKLGVDLRPKFLQSRSRIAVGQRFFYLEPMGHAPVPTATPGAPGTCDRPSDQRMRVSARADEAWIAFYFSESDAQKLAARAAQPGNVSLLGALVDRFRAAAELVRKTIGSAIPGALSEDEVKRAGGSLLVQRAQLQLKLVQVLGTMQPLLAAFVRERAQEVVRAAQDPRCGLTIIVHVRGLAATPNATVNVIAGRRRP